MFTQVFIRTVNKYTEGPEHSKAAGSATVVGGSGRMSIEGTALIDADMTDPNADNILFDEVVLEVNKCGCTNLTVYYIMAALFATIVLSVIVVVAANNAVADSVFIIVAILALVALVVSCFVRYCAFCQYPKGADE